MAERTLASPIADAPERVGHPGALSLEKTRLGPGFGAPDLVLFPDPARSPRRLVLVEAARSEGLGAAHRLVGRLMTHYSRALLLGEAGVEQLRCVARALRDEGTRPRRLSYKRAMGTDNRAEAGLLLASGRRLAPSEVALLAVLDATALEAAERLAKLARTLREHHDLDLKVVVVDGESIALL